MAAWSCAALHAQDRAGQAVHRCVGEHGEIVFSGLPCATPAPANAAAPGSAPAEAAVCPASREALRDLLTAAIARHDANAIAGLLRWRGVGAAAAASRLRMLRELVQQPLLAIDSGSDAGTAPTETATNAAAVDASDGLRVRTGGNESGGLREHAFGIDVDSGCYWLVW